MNIVQYLYSVYGFVAMTMMIIISEKMSINVSYKNDYLYSWIIYCALLNIIFIVIDQYYLNEVYKFVYSLMVNMMKLFKVREELFTYIKYYNILDNIVVKEDYNLITELSKQSLIYDDIGTSKNNRNSLMSKFFVYDNNILNISNMMIAIGCNVAIIVMALINTIYITHYFILFCIILGITIMNYSVYVVNEDSPVIQASLFLNKVRYMLFFMGFMIYTASFDYVIWMMCCLLIVSVYWFNERECFYNASDISWVFKFFYGDYLKFMVFFMTFVICILIVYMEYMSLLKPVNLVEIDSVLF